MILLAVASSLDEHCYVYTYTVANEIIVIYS